MKKWFAPLLILISFFSTAQSLPLKKIMDEMQVFEKKENYAAAKLCLSSFLLNKNLANQEIQFAKSYLIYYDCLIDEDVTIQEFDSAINPLLKVSERAYYETELLLNLLTQKYFLVADKEFWESAYL